MRRKQAVLVTMEIVVEVDDRVSADSVQKAVEEGILEHVSAGDVYLIGDDEPQDAEIDIVSVGLR